MLGFLKKVLNLLKKNRCSDAEFSKEYSFIPLLSHWLTPERQKQKVEELENIGKEKKEKENELQDR